MLDAHQIAIRGGRRTSTSSISAPGYETLVTHIFDRQSKYLDSDTVFAVKDSLITDFAEQTTQDETAKRLGVPTPYAAVHYDFVLKKA